MCKAALKALSVALGKQLRRREWTGRLEERRRGGPGRVSGSRRRRQFRCCRDREKEAWAGQCGRPGSSDQEASDQLVRAELADLVT